MTRWMFCRTCWAHVRSDVVSAHIGHDVRYDKGWHSPMWCVPCVKCGGTYVRKADKLPKRGLNSDRGDDDLDDYEF
jgi:hypothetical protein